MTAVPPLAPDELVSTSGERQVLETFLDLYRDAPSPGHGWTLSSSDTAETLLAGYEQACADSRRAAAGLSLDHCVQHPRLGQVSLRWIYVHMIEESARHVGHADILREQTDGATGFDG
jgi:hypothetical protein